MPMLGGARSPIGWNKYEEIIPFVEWEFIIERSSPRFKV